MREWLEVAMRLKFEEGVSWTKLAAAVMQETGIDGLTYDQVRNALRRHPDYRKPIQYNDKKSYTADDVDDYIHAMIDLQTAADKLNTKQVKASLTLPDDKPVGVVGWADWHHGGKGVDYLTFQEHHSKIVNTEGLYWIGLGDYKDNYISGTHVGGNFEQIIQPGMQDKMVIHYVRKAGEKCLALTAGCHDVWTKKQADKDFLEELCEAADCINLWHGGELNITVGEATYLWRCRHKYKFQSQLNFENAMRRIMEVQGPCDVAAEAHLHNAYIMDRHIMGEFRILMRSGSYKVWDEYGQQLAGYKGKIDVPMVVMFPDKHKLVPFRDLDTGIEYLQAVRNR
jgi:hypothetical protein